MANPAQSIDEAGMKRLEISQKNQDTTEFSKADTVTQESFMAAGLGPPVALESALRSHVHEVMRSREENRNLMDKFKVAESMYAEKEKHSTALLKRMQDEVNDLRKTNEKYKLALEAQRSSKDVFMVKVKEIATTIELLKQRDNAAQAQNADLKKDKERMTLENDELRRKLDDKEEHMKQCAELSLKKEENDARAFELLKKEHKNELQSMQNSHDLRVKKIMDETKTDYVPNNTYIKLREAYETVLADKQVLEESVGIVDRSLKETNQALKEKEDELHGMKRKIKESEKDFLAASLRGERSERDTEALKEEVDRAAKVIHAHEERIVALEREKSMLLTQVASLKFDASRRDAALAESRSKEEERDPS